MRNSKFDVWFNGLPRKERNKMIGPKVDMQHCFNAGYDLGIGDIDSKKAVAQLNAINTIFFMGNTNRNEALRELGLVDEKYAQLAEDDGLLVLAEVIRGEKP